MSLDPSVGIIKYSNIEAGEHGGWLKPGDEVELEIERLGVLKNRLVADA